MSWPVPGVYKLSQSQEGEALISKGASSFNIQPAKMKGADFKELIVESI